MSVDKKEQQMRISDEDISLLKSTFAENDVLLKTVRKALLGLPMKPDEAKYLSSLYEANTALQSVLRKIFLPEIDGDTPLGQQVDLYMTFSMEGKTPEEIYLSTKAREKLIKLLEDGLKNISGGKLSEGIDKYWPVDDPEDNYIRLVSRNTLITHVDQQLIQIKVLAGKKDETVEQTKERLKKDSSK